MQLSGVRPSVCLSRLSVSSGLRKLLRWVCCYGLGRQQMSIDCCKAGGQQEPRSSKCGQCHVVSRRRKPNADLFEYSNEVQSYSRSATAVSVAD